MNTNVFKRNELLAQKTIAGLESRNMKGYYAASREEALKIALDLIPEGSSITMGGAMSVHETITISSTAIIMKTRGRPCSWLTMQISSSHQPMP